MDTICNPHRKCRVTWLFAVVALVTGVLAGEVREYCQFDSLEASCPEGHVIVMEHAYYGRMNTGGCVRKGYGEVGCQANVLPFVDSVCSGRRECTLEVPDISQQGIRPCSEELTSYLEASYACFPVVTPREAQCRYDNFYSLPPPSGYLASDVIQSGGSGRASCSWRLMASPGQRINLTLFDFSAWQYGQGGGGNIGRTVCRRYAIISEGGGVRETPICGGQTRLRNIYVSEGNMVDLRLMNSNNPDEKAYFLIKYDTFGCPQMKPPRNAHIVRSGGDWVVKCNHTDQSWRVRCDGKAWVGGVGNCSTATNENLWNVLTDDWSSPYGVLIVVGLGIILGVIVGIILLVLALLWLRRSRRNKRNSGSPQVKTLAEVECEDPFMHSYQAPYNGEPDYASWINQRPLPQPARETASLKLCPRDVHLIDPLGRSDRSFSTLPRQNHQNGHVYESPKFGRRDSSPMDG